MEDGKNSFIMFLEGQADKQKDWGKDRLLGWAPGDYWNRCDVCKDAYFGDKRSFQCYPCAHRKSYSTTGCLCTFAQRMGGDGCYICNPQRAEEILKQNEENSEDETAH